MKNATTNDVNHDFVPVETKTLDSSLLTVIVLGKLLELFFKPGMSNLAYKFGQIGPKWNKSDKMYEI